MSLKSARGRPREPGKPTELWIYRYDTSATNRGGRRELVFNAKPESGAENALYRLFGAGRYRLEWRDARRWVVRVKVVDVRVSATREGRKPAASTRAVPPPEPLPRRAVRTEPLIERPREDGMPASEPPRWELIGPPLDLRDGAAIARWLDHVARRIGEAIQTAHRSIERAAKEKTIGKAALATYRKTVAGVSAQLNDFVTRGLEMGQFARSRADAEQIYSWAAPALRRLRKVEKAVAAGATKR